MEEIILESIELPVVKYYAKYDSDYRVLEIYPSTSRPENSAYVSDELANEVFEGKLSLNSLHIAKNENFPVVRKPVHLKMLDNTLYRVPNKKYTKVPDPDVVIEYNSKKKELSIKFPANKKHQSMKWESSSKLVFIISEYNNPFSVIEDFVISVDELRLSKYVKNIDLEVDKFSVFTRRIFEKYVLVQK